jgi:hypothetical protein
MNLMRSRVIMAVVGTLAGAHAMAQTTPTEPNPAAQSAVQVSGQVAEPSAAPGVGLEAPEKAWTFYASAFFYIVPDDRDFVQPTFMADHDWLHLEVRYNYEALDTGSAWFGINFSGGEDVTWEVTPMAGAVFGDTTGVAPGYRLSLNWWKLEFSTEGEYVFDTDDSSDSFFYSWSELSLAPVEWFRFGIVLQRTRVFEEDRDLQFGLLAGLAVGKFDASAYIFNLDEDTPTLALSVGLSF